MSEYQLSSILTQGRVVHMAVIGCGGTGSAFASGLPCLHQAMRALGLQGLQVTLLGRLFWHGSIDYHGAFLNLATGKSTPLPIDQKQWQRLSRWNRKKAA